MVAIRFLQSSQFIQAGFASGIEMSFNVVPDVLRMRIQNVAG
jgi:hypothetical protein